MPITDDSRYLFLLRALAVLLLLYIVIGFSIYSEMQQFASAVDIGLLLSIVLLLLFAVSYTCLLIADASGNTTWSWRLLWISALQVVVLHFTMRELSPLLNLIAFWVARTPQHFNLRSCTWLALVALAFFMAMTWWRDDESAGFLVILALLGLAALFFVLTISYAGLSLQRQRQQALQLNRELQAAQLLLAQSSRSGERLRIARDIHDLLGHQMTALILNLEVATHKASGEAAEQVQSALALARMLLGDLRNAVSDMRENPALDFDAALDELLANVPQLRVTLERQPGCVVPDPQVAEVLLRCIQEALTNTLRHAGASSCHIRLYAEAGQLVLDVSDDGRGAARIKPGNGLKGMQERLAALAGELQWWSDQDGFRLRAQLPLAGAGP